MRHISAFCGNRAAAAALALVSAATVVAATPRGAAAQSLDVPGLLLEISHRGLGSLGEVVTGIAEARQKGLPDGHGAAVAGGAILGGAVGGAAGLAFGKTMESPVKGALVGIGIGSAGSAVGNFGANVAATNGALNTINNERYRRLVQPKGNLELQLNYCNSQGLSQQACLQRRDVMEYSEEIRQINLDACEAGRPYAAEWHIANYSCR